MLKKIAKFSLFMASVVGFVSLMFLLIPHEAPGFQAIVFGVGLIALSMIFEGLLNSALSEDVANIKRERKILTDKIEANKDVDIFETIQLSLNQLSEYYAINKAQAKRSYLFSLMAIIIGLLTVLLGVGYYYTGRSNLSTTIISSVSGILLEFIGGAYFFMYKKSLEQVNFFFGQLIKIQDTMLSINMARNIADEGRRTDIEEKIILSLLERSLK